MTPSSSASIDPQSGNLLAPLVALEPRPEVNREQMIAQLRLLWTERRLLLRATAVGLLFAAVTAFLIPKRYQSTARLMPPDPPPSYAAALAGMSAAGAVPSAVPAALGLKTPGELFVGILKSRTLADRLIDRFQLRKTYSVRWYEEARTKLAARTTISEDRKSGIITITVSDSSAARATGLAQAYTEELNWLVAQLTTSAAHRERVFLQGRLREVQRDLENAEKDFSRFASQNTAVNIEEQGKAMFDTAAKLQGQLIAAHSELEGLRQIYSDHNVRVRSVQARISELERRLDEFGGKAKAGRISADPLYPSIRQLPVLGVPYADLYRRIKVQETVLEVLTRQYELAKVEEVREIPSVKVLDPASVPEKKSFPPRALLVCLGTAFSLAFAIMWVLARARWNQADPQDPGKVLAQEVFTSAKARMAWIAEKAPAMLTSSRVPAGRAEA